jgi:signal transduction histidine kinase
MEQETAANAALPWGHSLLARVVLALGLFMALLGAGLYFAIEHFVSGQFRALHGAEAQQLAVRLGQMARDELERFDGMARLLAADADLRNATYYHLFLEGEREHPQAAVERIARAFRLHSASLRDAEGRLLVAYSAGTPDGTPVFAEDSGRLLWHGDRVWAFARAPVIREGSPIAHLVLAKPAEELFPRNFLDRHEARAAFVPAPGASGAEAAVTIPLPAAERPVMLRLDLPDTVGEALAEVKRLIAAGVAAAGLLLVIGFALFLRWQMAPLSALAKAVAATGRGQFGQTVEVSGRGEISFLVRSFNAMSAGLLKLRELERRLAHQEQLSAIGRVAARVAHDINNPITVISNTAKLMARQGVSAAQQEDLDLILHHSDRCMDTVRALLEFGRPVRINARLLELGATLREIGGHWQAGAADTPLALELPGEELRLMADPLSLEQMLVNLLDNARQANPGGPVVLAAGREGNHAWLRVTDTGPGFPPEVRERLFEPFFTTKTGGTGLGLASALAIARAHGGDIEIEAAGAGGRVTVRLPLKPA